jgi:ketosteroid isomerase-like protein
MNRTIVSGCVLAIVTIGCAKPAPDTSADVAAINAVRGRELEAFTGGRPDSLVAVFTTDVILTPPNEAQLNGAVALRAWAANVASSVTVEGRYTSSDVQVAGDWAVDRYTAVLTMTPKAGGPSTRERLRGVHILRRQADGSWRIAQDIWNADAPQAAAAPTPPARRR